MEYDLRKDIDRFKHFLDVLEATLQKQGITDLNLMEMFDKFYDRSEVDTVNIQLFNSLSTLRTDLTSFNTTLNSLRNNLIDFNGELISFDEDNTNLSSDLSKLKDNLHLFIVSVNNLSSHLNELEGSLDSLDDNIFGDDGLNEQLEALDSTLNDPSTGLITQINGLDNRVFGNGGLSDSIFGTNGLSSRITNAEGGLSNLVYSLDVLSGYLTTFEGSLSELEDELEDNPNIDVSQLNSDIVALFGAIGTVKSNVTTVEDNLTDVSDSFDGVKTNLYGTKTVTVEGQQVTVPKEPTDTADSTSLRGHLTTLKDTTVPAVQNTLYGGAGHSPTNPTDNSVIGKANAVRTDLYGTGDATTPQTGSVKANLNQVKNTDIPAVQDILYGNGTEQNPASGSLLGDVYDSTTGLEKAHEHIENVQGIMYGNGTAQNPANGSLMADVNGTINKIGDADTQGTILYDIDQAQGGITDLETSVGDVNVDVNNDLQTQIISLIGLVKGMIPVIADVDTLSDVADSRTSRGNLRVANGAYPYDAIHTLDTDKYYVREYFESGLLGYYGEWVEKSTPYTNFTNTEFYDILNDYFTTIGHNHTISDITNLSTTLNSKQDTIPNFTQIGSTQTMYGVPVSTYSDGLNVCIVFDGTLNGNSSIPSQGSQGQIGTLSNTDYAPYFDVYSTVHTSATATKIRITNDGKVYLINGNSSKSYDLKCMVSYPLKSRFPSLL